MICRHCRKALATSGFRHDGEILYVTDDDRRELKCWKDPRRLWHEPADRLQVTAEWACALMRGESYPIVVRRMGDLADADWQQDWQQAADVGVM
jgi:hypothetical protein